MKKIFILIVSLGLLYPDRPFAQNSIKLYPYQMPPSHHPDYQRHHVKSPDVNPAKRNAMVVKNEM